MSALGPLLFAAPLVPLAAAALAFAVPAGLVRVALALAALPGVAAGLIVAGAAAPVRIAAPGFLFGAEVGIEPALGWPMAAVATVWGLAALHGLASGEAGPAARRYALCFGIAMAGQMATFVARDLASFYVGFAALSFAGYGLVAHRGGAAATRAARIYVAFVVFGELALFAALALIAAAQGGGLATPLDAGIAPSALAYWLLAAGFGVKAGLAPLHAWLPLAHPVAPVPASAALSGATLKAGLVGLLLFAPVADAPAGFGEALLTLGLIGGFGGAALAALQRDAKTALAWSSVSQMGLALALWGAAASGRAAPEAAAAALALFIVHHALAKAALFLVVEPGMPRRLALAVAALPALSLTGAPLTLGYAAKAATGAALGEGPLAMVFAAAAFGTALAMARALWLMAAKPAEPDNLRALAVVSAAVALLVAAPAALGAGVIPKDPAGAGIAAAPALVALALAAALSRLGVQPPGFATADPVAFAAPLRTVVSGAFRTFDALVSAIESMRREARATLGRTEAGSVGRKVSDGEHSGWLVAGLVGLAALAALTLAG
jgi:formate hydrogenlyase subunit 3/multisubunit Na+/H+ antiporter MnhD subunit